MRTGKSSPRGVSAINRDVVVFAFFLVLSFGLWYINSLGNETEADIRYPLRYVNLPKDRVIDDSPSRLNLSLKGPGYSVLKLKVTGNRQPITIDLSKVILKRASENNPLNYYIITSGLTKSLSVQIRSGCEVISVKPDTLFIALRKFPDNSVRDKGNNKRVENNNNGF